MEPYLEKAVRTGKLIVPSKLGIVPEQAFSMQLRELSLAGNMLKTLDPRIGDLHRLTSLNLSLNGLDDIPPELSSLVELETLNLNDNRLKFLSEVAVSFLKLTRLDVSNNSLVALPFGLLDLHGLTDLNVAGNKLKDLPKDSGKTISRLTDLASINLSRNKFKRVTSELSKLANLTEVDLSENRFVSWPKALNQSSKLTRLYLTANSITNLDDMSSIGEGCLTSLQELSLDMNQIADIPEDICRLSGLQELSLSDNETLSTLPRGILNCIDLSTLEIDGTDIRPMQLPPEVLQFLKDRDLVDLSDDD